MPRTLLLEIGSDEIPARYLPLAFRELRNRSEDAFRGARLGYKNISVFGTPRRLCLYVEGLAESGDDVTQKVRGPSKKVAYDQEGNPTKALLGFAKSIGADPSEVTVEKENGGEYVYGTRFEKGQITPSILQKVLPGVVMGMECPYPLRWGDQDWRWYRAIRWLVCLFGSDVVPVEIAGKVAGRSTHGHRTLHPGEALIPDADSYFKVMADCFVIVDQDLRR
jgi:glycyl-tRNA synthetase beta chain